MILEISHLRQIISHLRQISQSGWEVSSVAEIVWPCTCCQVMVNSVEVYLYRTHFKVMVT